MNYETIIYEVHGHVAQIGFNRPHRLNAVVTELYRNVLDALDRAGRDDDVRVVVLTGKGRAFCVGADLKEHGKGERTEKEKREYIDLGNEVCRRIYTHEKVVIAAVNGYALGAGAEMACSSDFILMKQTAQIGFPETSLGTYIGGGLTEILPRLVGLAKSRELIMTGVRLSGNDALKIGLATRAIPEVEYEQEVRQFAETIASKAPYSIRFAKGHLNDACLGYAGRLTAEIEALWACMQTEDWHEGVQAFAENRAPVFHNR